MKIKEKRGKEDKGRSLRTRLIIKANLEGKSTEKKWPARATQKKKRGMRYLSGYQAKGRKREKRGCVKKRK